VEAASTITDAAFLTAQFAFARNVPTAKPKAVRDPGAKLIREEVIDKTTL
jgi:hypothetical protein